MNLSQETCPSAYYLSPTSMGKEAEKRLSYGKLSPNYLVKEVRSWVFAWFLMAKVSFAG